MAVQGHGDTPTPQDPHDYWARRVYFLEDGPNVALQLGPDGVLERHVTAGLDAPVAVRRYDDAGALLGTWSLVSDRQGSTLGALDSLGAQIAAAAAVSRNPFGAVEGLAPAGSEAPVSGYTGAAQSVSNGGGMVYLRNRWYDPQSGRFLTQDPIGLAGGVNLYAYAGNDPISFSDPFGLCPPCRMDGDGVAFIAHWESFSPVKYSDVAGNSTIGYGHLVQKGEQTPDTITQAQGLELLHSDVATKVNPSLDKITADLNQNQVNAVGSFVYNVGGSAFARSILPKLNKGDFAGATAVMSRYVNARDPRSREERPVRGLINRRAAEVELFNEKEKP